MEIMSISIGSFRYTHRIGRRNNTRKPVNILLLLVLFRASPIMNVWPPHSQPACSQISAALFLRSDCEVRVGTNLCWQYVCFSPAIEGLATSSQLKHWSGDCRVCRTCSTYPVREEWMHNRNRTIKLIQGSKFKTQKLTEKVGQPREPHPPRFRRPWLEELWRHSSCEIKG